MKMIRIKKSPLFIILVFSIIWAFTSSFQETNKLTKTQAIKAAEQFIIDNGYTDLPADKTKLNYELLDENNKDSVIAYRKNMLHKKAFCISERANRWDIGFLSTGVDLHKLDSIKSKTNLPGRAVIVMKNGEEIRMAHKVPLFSYFEKL